MEDRRNIGMMDARRRTGFAEKTKPCRFITEISVADDFQCHWAVQIDVERLVSDPHRTATQLDWFPVFAPHQFIMLKAFRWLVRCRLDRNVRNSLPGLNPAGKTLAKHADRTEFHCSRKFIAAA